MKKILILLLFISGCSEFQRVLSITKEAVPPIADAVFPGVGVTIGAIIGGISIVGGGISTLIIAKRKKSYQIKGGCYGK